MPDTRPAPDPLHLPPGVTDADGPPLRGLTLLAVEDSRFACDALRLMSLRSGARLRRADTLSTARRHLCCYRPDLVIVDLGLPDGRGETLIREIALRPSPRPWVLGLSGAPSGRAAALAAGADGFLEKPLPGLVAFQSVVLRLTGGAQPTEQDEGPMPPDPLALHDDLRHAAELLPAAPDYVAGFVEGVAREARDTALA
ncbi:MAG: response regulator, partial [Gemmobacter sp.]|nr:response regulator [Gemmobacter sp.]